MTEIQGCEPVTAASPRLSPKLSASTCLIPEASGPASRKVTSTQR